MYVLALVFALALQPVVNNSKATKTKYPSSQEPAHSLTSADAQGITTPSTQQGQAEAPEHQGKPDNPRYAVEIRKQPHPEDTPLFLWYLITTAAGVVVNAAIWIAILKQTNLNKEIADGAAKSAKAAEDSANALINSERAWVIDEISWTTGGSVLYPVTQPDGMPHTVADITLRCRNHGNTPAWVFELWVKMEVTNTLDPKPDLAGAELSSRIEPVAGDHKPEWRFESLRAEGWAGEGRFTMIYGVIKYRDIFSQDASDAQTRESWFGYRLVDGYTFERLAHSKYNNNT